MKKAFTLIEVLVATLIFFLVTMAVFEAVSNSKFLFQKIDEYKNFSLRSSIVFVEKKKRKNLYEELVDFNISNDKIIHTLKKYNIKLQTINDVSQEINITKTTFFINRLKAYDKHNSAYIYSLGLK